jgi:alpha/beta superfamily hydrolase
VLYIRGDQESAQQYPAEEFQRRAGGPCDVEIVPDCDHFYVGREAAIAGQVSAWFKRTLKL